MKIKYILISFLALTLTFSCEDSDIVKGGGVGFIGSFGSSMKRVNNTPVVATIGISKRVVDTLIVEISISNTMGITTSPAFNDTTSLLTLGFGPGDTERSFTIDYENADLDGIVDIVFTIKNVKGDFSESFNNKYTLKIEGKAQELPVIPGAISIKEAKQKPGETVTIVGYVNTPDYGFTNGQYYIQDDSAGINIIHFGNFGLVQRGNIVRLDGTIGEFAGQVQIDVDAVQILSPTTETPLPITIPAGEIIADGKYQGMLVQVGGVTISNASSWPTAPQAGGSGVNVNATAGGTSFIIRIDRGESFYDGSPAPTGSFTLSGVLGRFNADAQIYPFVEGDISTGGIVNPNEEVFELPFTDDFENCTTVGAFNIPENWKEVVVPGSKTDRGWGCDTNDGVSSSSSVRASSFGGAAGTDNAWLISAKKFGLAKATAASLSFDIKSAFSGSGSIKVLWSDSYTSGDPSAASWTELVEVVPKFPIQGTAVYKNISASLDGALGKNIYLAFQFIGGTEASSASYDIDNLSVTGTIDGGTGNTDPFTLPFTDDFESCATVGDFNIPSNWIELVAEGSKDDRGWGCRAFGRDGTSGPRASTFGGADGNDDAWLISAKPFDLTGATNPELVFWLESRFSGPGNLKVYWSADFDGSTLLSGTWSELTDIQSQIPAEGSQVFTEITSDLSVITENIVYLAFRYYEGTSAASVAFTIDDLSIAGD